MIEERYTDIRLVKVPLEIDNKNQLTFSSKTTQYNYFNGCEHIELDDSSYQRKDNVIRYPGHIDDLIGYNYCMYKNVKYSDKWYYAYITDMKYISDSMTLITIKTDVWQTWNFDLEIKRCFVEREHVNDDTIGANTIPEGLELGELTTAKECTVYKPDNDDFCICMAVTEMPDDTMPLFTEARTYSGIFSGVYYLAFYDGADCELAIKYYDHYGKADAIVSIFMVPKDLQEITGGIDRTWYSQSVGETCNVTYVSGYDYANTLELLEGRIPTKLGNNYVPKNQKLFTYPYSYAVLANNSGISEIFKYEDFDEDEIEHKIIMYFNVVASLTPGMSIKAIPLYYKHIDANYNYGVVAGKLPICSWNSDVYTNWLTQNGLSTALSAVGGLASTAFGAASGNVGSIVGGITGVYNSLHQFTLADMTPNQARGNTNAGDINFSYTADGFYTIYYMSIRDEIAKVIDNYFSTYGYKVNIIKVPNITGRTNWNYVKTIDCNIHAYIPQEDLIEIKNMFNSGVTFWHNPATFLDYSQNNTIVS